MVPHPSKTPSGDATRRVSSRPLGRAKPDLGDIERTVCAINDGGRWEFNQVGEPLEFEECEAYTRRRVSERLTAEMIERCFRPLGVDGFNENAYRTKHGAILGEEGGPPYPGAREYTFDAAQAR